MKIASSFFMAVVCTSFVQASQVANLSLDNGNRISVSSLDLENNVAKARYFGGDLSISFDQIASLSFEQEHLVYLKDHSILRGISSSGSKSFLAMVLENGEKVNIKKEEIIKIESADVYNAKEAKRISAAKQKVWAGDIDLGYIMQSGNTDDSKLNFLLKTKRDSKYDTFNIDLTTTQGKSNGLTTADSAKIRTRFDLKTRDKSFWFILSSLEYDKVKQIDLRSVLGLGTGRTVFNTPEKRFQWSLGFTGDKEIRNNHTEDSIVTGLFSTEFEKKVFQNSRFISELNFYPDLSDFSGNLKADAVFSIATPITNTASLKISLQQKYLGKVIAEVDKLDTTITTSLSYKF